MLKAGDLEEGRAAERKYAFHHAYKEGKFYPFKYWMAELNGRESDVDFDEDWLAELNLSKTRTALLKRMLQDIDVSAHFTWVDKDHFTGVNLCFFSDPHGTLAEADLGEMIGDAFATADSSSLDVIKAFRDMVIAETENLEKAIADKEVP